MHYSSQKTIIPILKQATPTIKSNFFRQSAKAILKLFGWQVVGTLPDAPKYIVIGAPHTSNWDFPFMLLAAISLGVKPYWMVKDTAIRWPVAGIARWMGALPINRRSKNNIVEQVAQTFVQYERLIVLIPPEGTRKRMARWKSGFYHIAVKANVPILLGFLDFRRQEAGVGSLFYPTGDFEADMRQIERFYNDKTAKFPHEASPILPERVSANQVT